MNMKLRVLGLLATLILGSSVAARADEPATADVSYQIFDFYNPTELLRDSTIRVQAHNDATGETFDADERSGNSFSLPVGSYTFSGRSAFCYLAPKTLDITVDTSSIDLYAGCE
jgi:hypothetical protein